ncbi:MAG: hypothetical protein WA160_14395 [Pseudobdellovibrio sp.]
MNKQIVLWALFCLMVLQTAYAENSVTKKLVEFETQANAAAQRSIDAILLPEVEIPLAMVEKDFAERINPLISKSLSFEKNGQPFVHWILNPEDTKWGSELIQHFQKLGLPLQIKYHFIGHQTASRSYIAEDPLTGIQFSVKSSTNVAGGKFTADKKQTIGSARDARLIGDFLNDQNQKRLFENFIFLDEPAILTISALDQALVIRDLGPMIQANNENFYLPGFSALHDKVGAEIARINGSTDPYQYWTDHYIKAVGKALGELAARTGMQFDSPHSQNFLIELDSKMKPTGKIVLRDLSDLYIDVNFITSLQGANSPLLIKFNQRTNLIDFINAGFGPLHGNEKPSWANSSVHTLKWKKVFFQEFESTFENISGFNIARLNTAKYQNGEKLSSTYKLFAHPKFKLFFEMMKKQGFVQNKQLTNRCENIFAL